jgi:hypothetical protein
LRCEQVPARLVEGHAEVADQAQLESLTHVACSADTSLLDRVFPELAATSTQDG